MSDQAEENKAKVDEAVVSRLVKEFNSSWKSSVDAIHTHVMQVRRRQPGRNVRDDGLLRESLVLRREGLSLPGR